MADPQAVNTVADNTNSFIQAVIRFFVDLGIALAKGKFPWLNVTPIKQFINWVASKAVTKISLPPKQLATEIIIDDQMEIKVGEAHDSRDNLKQALASGDKDAIKKASDDFDEKYGNLVHYDGSSTNAH